MPHDGDGSSRRDHTFVTDIVDDFTRVPAHDRAPFEIVRLGHNQAGSLDELMAAVATTDGRAPAIEALPDQPGDVPRTWVAVSKAERLLGWRPSPDLLTGLRASRAWLEA